MSTNTNKEKLISKTNKVSKKNLEDLENLYRAVSRIFIDRYVKEKLENPSKKILKK